MATVIVSQTRTATLRRYDERRSRSGNQGDQHVHGPAGSPGRVRESVRKPGVATYVEPSRRWLCGHHTLYTVADEPDTAVEIADWDSADSRDAMMQSEAMAAFAPLFELLAAPPSATVVNPLH
jgi:quinol monooxygenase YgiN